MNAKILIPLCAAAALMIGCSERDDTRESTTPTADDTSTPGGTSAPAPADPATSTTTPSTPETTPSDTAAPADTQQPTNPPPSGGQ